MTRDKHITWPTGQQAEQVSYNVQSHDDTAGKMFLLLALPISLAIVTSTLLFAWLRTGNQFGHTP